MRHHFATMGHEMGHHFVQMGHEGTPMGIKMVSHVVMVKHEASREVSTRFSEPDWLKNRARVAKTDPEPFCDFRRLWYTGSYKFSAQQGWRHGVHSRSLGGTSYILTKIGGAFLVSRPVGRFVFVGSVGLLRSLSVVAIAA